MTEAFSDDIFPPAPMAPDVEPDLRVAIILTPCFSLLPLACLLDCLRFAADTADYSRKIYCHWQIIAPEIAPIQASCGVEIYPEQTFQQAESCDYLIVIGGRLPMAMDVPATTLDYIKREHEGGRKIIGICTGSFVLARAGLLDGRKCAVNDLHLHQMRALYPSVQSITDVNFIDDGIITCGGGTTSLDLVFSLIESHCGKVRAQKALAGQVLDRRQLEEFNPERLYGHLYSCGNWRVEQAVNLMEQNFSKPLSIAVLAARLNTSVRALNRAFQKHADDVPSVICRRMRLAHGHWLLVNTARTITQIALECGFADAPHFSRMIKKAYGMTPGRVREVR